MTYSVSHSSPGYGDRYKRTYQKGYYAAQWLDVEKPLLSRIFRKYGGTKKTCLDFACGTGRITHLAAEYFGKVVGVDVSETMTEKIGSAPNLSIRNMDITSTPLGSRFDVVTAFRFFLNAERPLRSKVLEALSCHVKKDGILIANIHMNRGSPMGVLYTFLKKIRGKTWHHVASLEDFSAELEVAGFEVVEVHWYSFLPRLGPLFPYMSEKVLGGVEKLARKIRVPETFAQSFIVVARAK